MVAYRRHSRFTLWLTLVTMVLATLMPSISRAAAFAQGGAASWQDICSATVAAPKGNQDQSPNDSTLQLQADCPFCLLGAHMQAPPTPALAADLRHDLTHVQPYLFLHAPHTLHAWTTAQPRAPPLAI